MGSEEFYMAADRVADELCEAFDIKDDLPQWVINIALRLYRVLLPDFSLENFKSNREA